MTEENGSGKEKLKDLTRCNKDGLRASWGIEFSVLCWCCFLVSVLRLEVMKIVPIMRFRKQKRTVGVNQLATDSIMASFYCICRTWRRTAEGKKKEDERLKNEELWLEMRGSFYL